MNERALRFTDCGPAERPALRTLLAGGGEACAFLCQVCEREPDCLLLGYRAGALCAVAERHAERDAYLQLYVAPSARGQGLGTLLADRCEAELWAAGAATIQTACVDRDSLRFAARRGYAPYYASARMTRGGPPPAELPLPVRGYTAADYPQFQQILSTAFHRMRLAAGLSDSVPAAPDEADRLDWQRRAADTFVLCEGAEPVACGALDGDELDRIAVRPDRQGRGYGSAMLRFLLCELHRRGAETARLWCVEGNPARRLYERLGFQTQYVCHFPRKSRPE